MATMTTVAAPATPAPSIRAFSYWLLHYRRAWRGTFVISVLNPMLFLIGIGAGLGKLVDHHAPAQIAGVPYVAFFAPGMLAASSMQIGIPRVGRPGADGGRLVRRLPGRRSPRRSTRPTSSTGTCCSWRSGSPPAAPRSSP